MHCEMIQEQISELLDHELSVEAAQTVFSHLGTCPVCTVFYRQAGVIGKKIRQTGGPVFPPELDARMRHALDARSGARRRASGFLPERMSAIARRRIVLPVPLAAAAFVVSLFISIFLMRSFAPSLLPVEKETKIVVAYPAVEVVADQSITE